MPNFVAKFLHLRDRAAAWARRVEHLGAAHAIALARRNLPFARAAIVQSAPDWTAETTASLTRSLTDILVELAGRHGASTDPIGLTVALPRDGSDLDPRAAPIAMARLGLEARWIYVPLHAIEACHLPAVMELSGGGFALIESLGDHASLLVRDGHGKLHPVSKVSLVECVTGKILVMGAADPINGVADADDRAAIAKAPQKWILGLFLADRRLVGQLIFASVLVNLCSLAMPLFQRAIYDRVIPNLALESLWALSIGALIALAFEFALRGARSQFIEAQGLQVAQKVQTRILSSVLGARLEAAPKNAGAALVSLRDIDGLGLLAPTAIATFFVDLPFFLVFLGAIALLAGPLALVVIAGAAALIAVGLHSVRGSTRASARSMQLSRARNSLIVDVVGGLATIKANQAEGKFQRHWTSVNDHLAMTGHELRKSSEIGVSATNLVVQAVTIATIVVGVLLVKTGDLSAGSLIAATLLASRAMSPISTAVGIGVRAHQALGQFKAMSNLLALPPERDDPRASVTYVPKIGGFDLRGVSVRYDGSVEPALREISLHIAPGERIGLIGRSGSGKSTLIQVLAGLVAPTGGAVLVDGHNLQHFRIEQVRSGISYAAQDAVIFDAPLRDNLTLGLSQIDPEAIERAVRLAAVDRIAQLLPEGYSTVLGPHGSRLSGGQRQAIILARAFARGTAVLLLDEPTSAMDAQTEQAACAGIATASAGRTLIMATHRLELLGLVDRVIWMEDGRIKADLPRDDMLAVLSGRSPKRAAV